MNMCYHIRKHHKADVYLNRLLMNCGKPMIANFIKRGVFVDHDTASIQLKENKNMHKMHIFVKIANGNHGDDFDTIIITNEESLEILKIYRDINHYTVGYGTLELILDLPNNSTCHS